MVLGHRLSWALIGRQTKLLILTLRDTIRRPSRARRLGTMLRSLTSSTMELRLPWLPYDLIDVLDVYVATKRVRVFEYGGGGSTLWFAARAEHVHTVEHESGWVQQLKSQTSSLSNVTIDHVDLTADPGPYIHAIDAWPDEHFDLVVVDGRERVACVQQALPKLRPGGLLILDDTDRGRYRPAFDLVDWPRQTFIGFAPCKPTFGYTTVFSRPGRASDREP